ncbi:hypothetical protein niasHS_000746 [Heterodera schachtii]|uniref:Uncharacterized protein n=1 Tax=Heterodera schachtii TaxID=97005 RepID=A0ABD2KKZ6_HETSC
MFLSHYFSRTDCIRTFELDRGDSLQSHVRTHHGNDHNAYTNRKPNALGMALGVFSTHGNPAGVIGRTSLFTVRLNMEPDAGALAINFDADDAAQLGYLNAALPVRHCGHSAPPDQRQPPWRRLPGTESMETAYCWPHPPGDGQGGPGRVGGIAGGCEAGADAGVRRDGAAAAGRDVQAVAVGGAVSGCRR